MNANYEYDVNLEDPSIVVQRPTAHKVPDATHILAKTFGRKFTRDVLSTEVIKNLAVSSHVENDYHKNYVDKLKQAQIIKEQRIQEYANAEKHIFESKAKSLAIEDKDIDKRNKTCDNPDMLGIPPTKSYFNFCINNTFMKKNGLLGPNDYIKIKIEREDLNSKSENNLKQRTRNSNLRLPPLTNLQSKQSVETKEDSDEKIISTFWKENMSHNDRTMLRNLFKQYERKTRFKLNPRTDSQLAISQSIKTVPEIICFNKYVVGKVYEKKLELWNVSDVAQQLRVLPPKSQYFSLSLGQFPKLDSVIAPGMSAFYNIKFAPDSLCSFQDSVTVECSNGKNIIVPLIGKRPSPVLSIGPIFDCGKALVGQMKVCRYVILNSGGEGRFVILPKSQWPTTNFKSNVSTTNLNMNIFEIQPSIFEIQEGESFVIEIFFKPSDTGFFEQDIIMACDNCTTIEFKITGEGQLAEIELLENEETFDVINNDLDFKDFWAKKTIKFEDLNPNMFSKKKIGIQNKSSSPIDFSWLIYKPILEDNLFNEKTKYLYKYILDNESPFSIEPNNGTLERNATKFFEISFSPSQASSFHSVIHLILHGIPEINKQMLNDKLDEVHKTTLSKEDTFTSDHTSLQIELKGKCEPYQYTLDPPAIFFPSKFYQNSTFRKGFRLINMSLCPITFHWKHIVEPHVIQVEPSYGEIAAKSYALMDVLVTGTKPGKIKDTISCYIESVENPISLLIEAEIKGPECIIHQPSIDFGLLKIGTIAKSYFTVENTTNLLAKWSLSCDDTYKEILKYEKSGELKPLERKMIEIVISPTDELFLNTVFDFDIENGNKINLICTAQSKRPDVVLLESQIKIDDLFATVPYKKIIKLRNNGPLDAYYQWGNVENCAKDYCLISIQSYKGIIPAFTELDILIVINPLKVGYVGKMQIPCYVEDMVEPLFLDIEGTIRGALITYYFSNEITNPNLNEINKFKFLSLNKIKIDTNVEISKKTKKYLFIKNETPIRTNINLKIEKIQSETSESNLNSFREESPIELEKYNICIEAYQTIPLSFVCFKTMWGSYNYFLNVSVDGLDRVQKIPIKLNMTGPPVKIYATKTVGDSNEPISILRLGSQIQGTGTLVRKLKLQNLCDFQYEIKWRGYSVKKDDRQLIDLHLCILDNLKSDNNNVKNEDNYDDRNSVDLNENTIDKYPLIKTYLTPHYGTPLEQCEPNLFSLGLKEMILKPFETTYLNLYTNLDLNVHGSYEVVFVGYLNLPEKLTKSENFNRKTNFEMEPLKFKAIIDVVAPTLQIEYIRQDELLFELEMGDLINGDHILNEKKLHQSIFLTNNYYVPMKCKVSSDDPFYIFPSAKELTNNLEAVIEGKKKLKVDVIFYFKREIVFSYEEKYNSDIRFIETNIILSYPGNKTQLIPVSAKIHIPKLKIDTDYIDFGMVPVGRKRNRHLTLKNSSNSSLYFNITNNHQNDNDTTENIFIIDKLNGLIKKSSDQIINIEFFSEKEGMFEKEIIINNKLGNQKFFILIRGIATYDEQDETFLDT